MGKKENITLMDIVLLEGDNNTVKIGCVRKNYSKICEFRLEGDKVRVVDCLEKGKCVAIGAIMANCSYSNALIVDALSMKVNKNLITSWIKMVDGTGKVDLRDDCKSLFADDDNSSKAEENIKGAFIAEIMLEFSNVLEKLENISKSL